MSHSTEPTKPQTREGDLPEWELIAAWTFYPTMIGTVLFAAAYFIFVITAEV